jgi:polysaccharide export outer membrane protein
MTLTRLKRSSGLALILLASALLAGCFSDPNPHARAAFPGEKPGAPVGQAGANPAFVSHFSKLRIGDLIIVNFSDQLNPPPRQEINIPDGGVITLPFNVHVQAAGKTTTELEKDIRDAYVPNLFVNLTVTVKTEQRAFFVDGEVKNPGRQLYLGEMTVLRAIGTAGGFTDFANRKKIELRRQNGQNVIVDYNKALKEASLDLPVYPNDHIIVKRHLF